MKAIADTTEERSRKEYEASRDYTDRLRDNISATIVPLLIAARVCFAAFLKR